MRGAWEDGVKRCPAAGVAMIPSVAPRFGGAEKLVALSF